MNKKGQVGDILEFKISLIIFFVILFFAFILFNLSSILHPIFGGSREVSIRDDISDFQINVDEQDLLIDLLNENPKIVDLIAAHNSEKLLEELKKLNYYNLDVEYANGERVSSYQGRTLSGIIIPDFQGEIVTVRLAEVTYE